MIIFSFEWLINFIIWSVKLSKNGSTVRRMLAYVPFVFNLVSLNLRLIKILVSKN